MKVVILADDLTGANAAASLLKRQGLPSETHLCVWSEVGREPAFLEGDGAHVFELDPGFRTIG